MLSYELVGMQVFVKSGWDDIESHHLKPRKDLHQKSAKRAEPSVVVIKMML